MITGTADLKTALPMKAKNQIIKYIIYSRVEVLHWIMVRYER